MSDQLLPGGANGQAAPGEGEPGLVPGQEGAGKAAAAQPKYVTAEELAARDERIARQIQRGISKSENRMGSRIAQAQAGVDQTVAIMIAQGIKVTPEQIQAAKDEAGRRAMLPLPPAADGQPGALEPGDDGAEGGDEELDPITALGLRMLEDMGVKIEPSDLEAKLVDATGTPQRYLRTLAEAGSAKKARLSAKTPEQIEAEKQAALGRGGGALGTGAAAGEVVSTDSMLHFSKAFEKLPPERTKR